MKETTWHIGGLQVPLRMAAGGQRLSMRYHLAEGFLELRCPGGRLEGEASAFLHAKESWIRRQHARSLASRRQVATALGELEAGRLLLAGAYVPFRFEAGSRRRAFRQGDACLMICRPADLRHPRAALAAAFLRSWAENTLPARTQALAAETATPISAVRVRDQRSKWGSCASSGVISLNWRLVLMPDSVRDYVLYHELMHRREMNHSPRFWAHVAACCPDYARQRAWLREQGWLMHLYA